MGSRFERDLEIFWIWWELFVVLEYRLRILDVMVIGKGECVVVSEDRKLEKGVFLILRFICKWLKYCL